MTNPFDAITETLTPQEIELSRGFLRCSVSALVPGMLELWAAIVAAVGEVEIEEMGPQVQSRDSWSCVAVAGLGQESLSLYVNADEVSSFFIHPFTDQWSQDCTTEYLTRKFFHSVFLTYRGFGEELVWDRFESNATGYTPARAGIVLKLRSKKNGARLSMYLEFDPTLLNQIDAEWKKHITASATYQIPTEALVRMTQIAIQPTKLPELLSGKASQMIPNWRNQVEIVDSKGVSHFLGSLISYSNDRGQRSLAFKFLSSLQSETRSKMIRPGYVTVDVVVGTIKNLAQDALQDGACSRILASCEEVGRVGLYMHGEKIASAAIRHDQEGMHLEEIRSES
jgi:hypothetical protein